MQVYIKNKFGSVLFYKDGYTDVLGRFDYASISEARRSSGVKAMAALIVSPRTGCVITKLDTPSGLL